MFEITEGIFLTANEFKNNLRIDIRKWYKDKENEWKPTKKGISFNVDEWSDFVSSFEDIKNFVDKKGGNHGG